MHRSEYWNSLTHLLGAVAALVGLVVLVVLSSLQGDVWKIVSFSVYGACLFILYFFSMLYHAHDGTKKHILRKLDHVSIYLLIAGTYMPFMLISIRGAWGWSLFAVVCVLAIIGMAYDAVISKGRRVIPMVIYIMMGWVGLVAIEPLLDALSVGGFIWVLGGGAFYTIGILFFALDNKNPYYHTVWHMFVLAGSLSHYIALFVYVL